MLKRSIQKFVITILVNFMLVGSIVSNAMEAQMEVLTFVEEIEWREVVIVLGDVYGVVNEVGEYLCGYDDEGNFKSTSDINERWLMWGVNYRYYPVGQTFYVERIEDGYRIPFTAETGFVNAELLMPPLGEMEIETDSLTETEIETNIETESVTEMETETPIETEIETDTELESETKINTEVESASETEIKSELEIKLESESNTEKTSQTSSNSSVPKTGDTTTIGYLLGMLISSFGVVLFMNKRIKNKVNQK
jgi:hypothetical protein